MPETTSISTNLRAQLPLIAVLGLSSLLSVTLVLFRVAYSDTIVYTFLVWNLFLAWVPLGCALALLSLDGMPRRPYLLMAILFGSWFLFFPNAPYIVTDLIHLKSHYGAPIWYDAMLVFSFAWNGLILGLMSLWIVQRLVEGWYGKWMGWLLVAFTVIASGFGVYLGRFERWNSWDIVAEPQSLALDMLDRLLNPLAHPRTLAVTAIFAAFLTVAYLTLSVLVNSNWDEGTNREDRTRTVAIG